MATTKAARSSWGRARFGGSTALLIFLSLFGGLLLAAAMSWLWWQAGPAEDPQRKLLAAMAFGLIVLPATAAACWGIMLDRSTLKGATENPEASIEGRWYDKAAAGVFSDILLLCGLGAAAFAFLDLQAPVSLVLAAVIMLAMIDFGVRYLLLRKVES